MEIAASQEHGSKIAKRSARGWEYWKIFGFLLRDGLVSNDLFTRSAALAYNTLFSLLPVFVLSLIVVSMISAHAGDSGSLGAQLESWLLNQTGLEQIEISGSEHAGTQPHSVNLATFLTSRIEKMQEIVQSPSTGIIGFAVLLYGALNLMLVIERAFNHVYRWPQPRAWTRRLTLYWCVLTLGPLGVAGSLVLSRYVQNAAGTVISPGRGIFVPLSFLGGFIVSWTLLFFMYKLIPQAVVAWKSALLGGFVGAVMWELGKYGFGIYLRQFVGAQKWYGNLGLVPLFMLWIYLTWNFVLIGLQIAYVHQFYPALARQFSFRKRADGGMSDLRWVLPLAVLMHRRFRAGKPVTMDEACGELGMPSDVAEYLLRALRRAEIIHAVENDDKAFTLARPGDAITAADLLTAARSGCIASTACETPSDNDPRCAPAILEMQRRELEYQKTKTLAMLAGE